MATSSYFWFLHRSLLVAVSLIPCTFRSSLRLHIQHSVNERSVDTPTLGLAYHCCLGHKLSQHSSRPLSQLLLEGAGLPGPWMLSSILPALEALWGVTGLCFGRPLLTLPLMRAWLSVCCSWSLIKAAPLPDSDSAGSIIRPLTLPRLLQSQTIMLTLLVTNVRGYISVISSQVTFQRVHHTTVTQPRGHITPTTKAREDESLQLSSWLGLQWNSFHCLVFVFIFLLM